MATAGKLTSRQKGFIYDLANYASHTGEAINFRAVATKLGVDPKTVRYHAAQADGGGSYLTSSQAAKFLMSSTTTATPVAKTKTTTKTSSTPTKATSSNNSNVSFTTQQVKAIEEIVLNVVAKVLA